MPEPMGFPDEGPDEVLGYLRQLVKDNEYSNRWKGGHPGDGLAKPYETDEERADGLAHWVGELDRWIQQGGELPTDWKH